MPWQFLLISHLILSLLAWAMATSTPPLTIYHPASVVIIHFRATTKLDCTGKSRYVGQTWVHAHQPYARTMQNLSNTFHMCISIWRPFPMLSQSYFYLWWSFPNFLSACVRRPLPVMFTFCVYCPSMAFCCLRIRDYSTRSTLIWIQHNFSRKSSRVWLYNIMQI